MAKKNIKKEQRLSNIPQKDTNKSTDSVLVYTKDMTVADVAKGLNKPAAQVIGKLMQAGIMANQMQVLERETIELIALDFGFDVKDEVVTDVTRFDEFTISDDEGNLETRPAVVTIMGHVDHGKTTLLDVIRNTRVTSTEAGGITQHIGAYQIKRNDCAITFIDTPGHAAFTQMRARGALVTDIVILVVAADDGLMPQTEEAIAHAKAAKCPIIVAVNKMDKPSANPDRVMEELSRFDLIPEVWGGKTPFVNISALKNQGVDELLDMIQLVAELEDLKANPNRMATGTVIEAQLDKGRGSLATLMVQNGTLKVGDFIVVGNTYGKVRTMEDHLKTRYTQAAPSTPVMITGLSQVPSAGDKFMVFADEKMTKEVAEQRAHQAKTKELGGGKAVSLEELFNSNKGTKELNLIVKGDTQGCVEAIKGSLVKLSTEEVKVNTLRASVGSITDSDVTLAQASNAIIIGFNVRPMSQIRNSAEEKGVEIRTYSIIYRILEDIEQAAKGLLDPVYEEEVTGQAEVREIFKMSKVGTIAGCFVTEGVVKRDSIVRILRDGIVLFEGKMASLRRFKDDAKEVRAGFECGITIEKHNDIKIGDVFETAIMKEVKR